MCLPWMNHRANLHGCVRGIRRIAVLIIVRNDEFSWRVREEMAEKNQERRIEE
jgi:hypothetical protein